MQILSVDPALNNVGYAVIEKKDEIKILTSGVIKTKIEKKEEEGDYYKINNRESVDVLKIREIISHIQEIIKSYNISFVIIEETFVNVNLKSSLSLALARGSLIGFFTTFNEIKIFQINPKMVKKIITGNGNADKEQVLKMLKMLIPKYQKLQNIKKLDESDAIAIGLSFLISYKH